jgi:hypothetical protein
MTISIPISHNLARKLHVTFHAGGSYLETTAESLKIERLEV